MGLLNWEQTCLQLVQQAFNTKGEIFPVLYCLHSNAHGNGLHRHSNVTTEGQRGSWALKPLRAKIQSFKSIFVKQFKQVFTNVKQLTISQQTLSKLYAI